MLMLNVIKAKKYFQQFKRIVLMSFCIIYSTCDCGKQINTL